MVPTTPICFGSGSVPTVVSWTLTFPGMRKSELSVPLRLRRPRLPNHNRDLVFLECMFFFFASCCNELTIAPYAFLLIFSA